MHMHMTMLGRADAAVDRIDIGDNLSGPGPIVNRTPLVCREHMICPLS
jgi:hypothetical protein